MSKRNHISEREVHEIQKARKKNKDKNIDRRLEALLLHAAGKKRADIAEKTGYGKQYITELVGEYRKNGLAHYVQKHYKGNHRNLSYAQEEALLETFKKQAEAGQLVEVSAIRAAYEAKLGRSIESSHGHIYRVLKRHGWRRVMPRGKHPKKANDEAVEASKKLTQWSKTRWQIIPVEKSD